MRISLAEALDLTPLACEVIDYVLDDWEESLPDPSGGDSSETYKWE